MNMYLRFRKEHEHLESAYGNDWFARKAESFARFFGTPLFLIIQTLIVVMWVIVNVTGLASFDAYPFIFLNLAFSLQAAYAAPLILLAQTRQADRDKAHGEADAKHREEISDNIQKQQAVITEQTENLLRLMKQNVTLTEVTKTLSERIEKLTEEIHLKIK